MKISKKKAQGEWHKFDEDVSFKIKPFPHSKWAEGDFRVDKDGNADIGMEFEWFRFDACLHDWKGLEDEKGKKLKCDAANKQFIYDYEDDLRNFVVQIAFGLDEDLSKQVKN